MNVVVMAWGYVALLMAAAEAISPQGTIFGALVTLLLYGVLPMGIVMYIMGTPGRKKLRRAAEQAASAQADGSGHAPGGPPQSLSAERKEA